MEKKHSSGEIIPAKTASAFERWDMPIFDESDEAISSKQADAEAEQEPEPEPETRVEEVELEEVQPLTMEEVEAVRQDAYNEGFSAGEKDGFHSGQLKAQKENEAAIAPRLQALEQIMRQLFDPIAEQDQALEQAMLELVQLISEQVIQRELQLDSSQISHAIREALKLLPRESEQVRVYLNPQDFEQIKAMRQRQEENWRLIEDEALLPGGCRVEAADTLIDASIETRTKTLTKQLLEQQRTLKADPVEADAIQEFDLEPAPIEPEPEPELDSDPAPETEAEPRPETESASESHDAALLEEQAQGVEPAQSTEAEQPL